MKVSSKHAQVALRILSTKGLPGRKQGRKGEDKMEEKREESCLVLLKRVVVGEAGPPLGSYMCLSDPTLKSPTS